MLNGTYRGSHGLGLIRRYADGEELEEQELISMQATMYLLTLYLNPQRSWEDFLWRGSDHFVEEIWPMILERREIQSDLFGHGSVSP